MPVLDVNEQKVFKTFQTVDLYFTAEFRMTFHFLALKIRSRTSVVQVNTAALHASLCIWILTICRVGAGGGI
jgi:hypothetical protein